MTTMPLEITGRTPRPLVTVTCEYCGSSDSKTLTGPLTDCELADELPLAFRGLTFTFVQCLHCGLVYLRERPDPGDVSCYYPETYKCFQSYDERGLIMKKLAQGVARRKLQEIARFMPAGNRTLLDYGCGSGTWLSLLQDLGCNYRMIGTDITAGPLQELRPRGIEAYACDEKTIGKHVAAASVGVVHLFHVIEHVADASAVLESIRQILVPGGVLIGQTPNVDSLGRRVWGDLWNQWHAPQHFVLFSDRTLRRHAEKAGFEVVKIASSISGATQWALSFLHLWANWRGRQFHHIHEPLYPPLIIAAMPVAVVEAMFSRTCHMDFVLRKRG
ncbi:MAG TPA: class I SAM-dependent methyltransferase [Terriglobia bacterium]|jgi:2-polyprenyl-3-methyl-5-hydroxy-6-metoxy-1,4-benzoquinol methylase